MHTLLKFITCGSVDDGKSTLIGHMLYDAKLLFADQEKALELDSQIGSAGGAMDYSLLLDGLMAEREQGITIDVAYRYFTTDARSFIVADTPGHEEYTRNMAVGASFADLAVILADAGKGILAQTKRHTRICALMGIRHFVFAVNKMDLVEYSQECFLEIQNDIRILTKEFDCDSIALIPVSASCGDNITRRSARMPWYPGMPLLAYLENIDISREPEGTGFTMPVQRVCRPDRNFRGFQGQIESGAVSVGDAVTVLPSTETAKVTGILQGNQPVETSSAGHAVTISLDTEIDISRGCVLQKDNQLFVSQTFTVTLLWMDNSGLTAGKSYLIKTGTQRIPCTVLHIHHKVDTGTGQEVPAKEIIKNEIACCDLMTNTEIVFDTFLHNKALGSFILIDRVTHMTAACGTITHSLAQDNSHLTWQNTDITRTFRENLLGQKACTIWFTGLSGSGKSTLANALEKYLAGVNKHTMLLDGDNIRMGLNRNLGFGESDRIENIRRVAEVAKLLNDAGLIVLTSFISPFAADRRRAKKIIGEGFFFFFFSTPLEECIRRDVKGLYADAKSGRIEDFTGLGSPYEVPEHADLTIDTTGKTIDECVQTLVQKLNL